MMKNKNQSTINAAISSVGEIVNEVGDAVVDIAENVAQASQAVDETISTIEDTVDEVKQIADDAPSFNEVMRAITKDARVGHFIVDVLSGMNVIEASKNHFKDAEEPSIDSLVKEAEQRGYLRGRNEQIEVKMRETAPETSAQPLRNETSILNRIRRSVWER